MAWAKKTYPHGVHLKLSDKYTAGILDTLHFIDGVTLWIELKVPGKKPSKLQQHNINKVIANRYLRKGMYHFETIVATWVDNLEDFKKVFERILK
jgi:hypothetical protein